MIAAYLPCHTGENSCFYRKIIDEQSEVVVEKIINSLYALILERKHHPIECSYTNYLFEKGLDKILKKVGEETAEVIIAAKNVAKEEMIYEISDLIYHLLVLIVEKDCSLNDIYEELSKRFNNKKIQIK